jgi:hypothetical protein
MRNLVRYRPGGFGRGAPRRLALVAVALAALLSDGCASDPCGSGGGCGGVWKRLSSCNLFDGSMKDRLLHRRPADACAPGVSGDGCAPGAIGAGTLMPGPGVVAPAPSEDIDLTPVSPGSAPGTGAAPGAVQSTTKTGSQAQYQSGRRRGESQLARRSPATRSITPEPASRPAAGAAPSTATDDPLVNLPPLETPVDRRESTTPSAVPVEADKIAKTSGEVPTTKPANESKPATPVSGTNPPAELPPKPIDTGFTPAPGIKRFKSVEPQLSGGSLPNAAGWDWLLEASYKTLLDLRDPTEDRHEVVAIAASKGFRYVSLSVSPDRLNPETLRRFREELSMAGGRPLYFFDTDGTRAAALWYLKLVAIDKIDSASARKTVEDLGTLNSLFEQATTKCLDQLKTTTASFPEAAPSSVPASISIPAAPASVPSAIPSASSTETKQVDPGPQSQGASPVTAATVSPSPASSRAPNTKTTDPTSWRSYAALLVTGLSVPLAYIGRSALSFGHHARRASLPAPEQEPKSAPVASGEGR